MLFMLGVIDTTNTNAQSLNAREIVLRLDPERFESTLWYEYEPDPRLVGRAGIHLLKLPSRGKTWRILREMLSGYDVIAYMDFSPASYLFLHLPRIVRSRATTVYHIEASTTQLVNPSRMQRFLFDRTFPRGDVHTGITNFVAREVSDHIKTKVSYVFPIGVDTGFFTPPSKRANQPPVILFAGTLIERKGPQIVVDAAARFPNARFRLVGAGRKGYEKVVQKTITQRGLTNIELEGPKTQLQMRDIMRESDIFLLPSRLEGMPKVTLEAAATGLPCVVFRDYQTPSVIDGVTGFQVETVEEMMQALEKLLVDSSLRQRMGAAAREHAGKFDWDVVSLQWQSAYIEIAANRTAGSQFRIAKKHSR